MGFLQIREAGQLLGREVPVARKVFNSLPRVQSLSKLSDRGLHFTYICIPLLQIRHQSEKNYAAYTMRCLYLDETTYAPLCFHYTLLNAPLPVNASLCCKFTLYSFFLRPCTFFVAFAFSFHRYFRNRLIFFFV